MKKILFLFCLVNVLNTSAQDLPEIDDRLLFRFTQSQLDDIASVNPNQIKYLNFYLNNSYYFQDAALFLIKSYKIIKMSSNIFLCLQITN